jgi:hypothetical protein
MMHTGYSLMGPSLTLLLLPPPPGRNVSGTDLCGSPLPASSHVVIGSNDPLPKCSSTCRKALLTRSYTFTVRSTSDFGAVRSTLRAALQKVYRHYNTPYPSATALAGPPGQGRPAGSTKRVTWRFRATLAIGAKNQCQPRGDAMHAALRGALAIPGSSVKAWAKAEALMLRVVEPVSVFLLQVRSGAS